MIANGVKKSVRSLIAGVLYYTGFMFILALVRFRRRVVVLMYHRILNPSEYHSAASQKGIIVTTGSFRKQMSFLKRLAHVLSLSLFLQHLRDGTPFENRSCLVTFDDGWEDNFRNAFPILQEFQIPAVIFLSGSHIETQKKFWQEDFLLSVREIRRLFEKDDKFLKKVSENPVLKKISGIITASDESMDQEAQVLINQLKKWDRQKRDQLLASLKDLTGQTAFSEVDIARRSFMSKPEVREMMGKGIAFGSHGMSHEILTILNAEEVQRELSESRKFLRNNLGIEAEVFSYPNGNYNESIIDTAKQNGYGAAFGTQNGYVQLGDNPYTLHRIGIHEDMTGTNPLFFARLLRLW